MNKSVISLVNAYMKSKDFKNESWYKKLDQDEKEFIDQLDKSISRGIEEGIKEYELKKGIIH